MIRILFIVFLVPALIFASTSETSNKLASPTPFSTILNRRNNATNKPINVIIIGGSSGMGKATAISTIARGGNALIISRSQEKLDSCRSYIQAKAITLTNDKIGKVYTAVLDVTDEQAMEKFVQEKLPTIINQNEEVDADNSVSIKWDALVFSAAGRAPHGPITKLPTSQTRELFETKFWGAYHSAKYFSTHLQDNGCIVFVSGVLNRRPGLNCSPLASTNGALEGLTRSLALELAPRLRVNCLSPGFCDTERFDHMDAAVKQAMLQNTAESLPLQRVGIPEDMGEAIFSLIGLKFVTGVVLDCDGGHHIRQYANKNTDPMRT